MILGKGPIGEAIMQLRKDQGMTRAQLAQASGLLERTIGRIENGEHQRAEWETVVRLLNGLGGYLDYTFRKPPDMASTDASSTPSS